MASERAPQPMPALGGLEEILIFIRAEGFYPIQGLANVDLRKQAEDGAICNPGTLRVEDIHGNVLWVLQ